MNDHAVPEVGAVEAQRLVDHEGAMLIDCREQKEWDAKRIPGAELKPMSTVNDWYQDLPTDRTIVLHCRSGDRSTQLTRALATQAGMTNIFNLAGGIIAWDKAGLPIER